MVGDWLTLAVTAAICAARLFRATASAGPTISLPRAYQGRESKKATAKMSESGRVKFVASQNKNKSTNP